jgi:hypothetical protein
VGAHRIEGRKTVITEEGRPKPPELVRLYAATPRAFRTLKEEFQVPDIYELALHDVDAAEPFLQSTLDIAAITMRKIQALRWVTKPGVETANDVVVTLAADLLRALDYLVRCCGDETKADELTTFKNQVVLAARRAGGDGGVARLSLGCGEVFLAPTSRMVVASGHNGTRWPGTLWLLWSCADIPVGNHGSLITKLRPGIFIMQLSIDQAPDHRRWHHLSQ